MTSSESSKTTLKPAPQQWVKPVCAVGGVVTVCGFGVYFLKKPGGTDMVKALVPAIVAVVAIAK
ncbi:hypothetical protein ACOACQ_19240 [Nocardioides sp. CPCC 206347]|uniref:hypothetical protein n=1 Tax=unclassified Nocardioides TaxID=2615069 RepID=UPI003619D808